MKVERVNNNRAILVSWTPLTLHQARGFPVYFVTYQPSLQVGRVVCTVNTVSTNDSSVLVVTLTQQQNTPFLWMSAQQRANCEALWVQVSPCYISDWTNIYGRHVANWAKLKFYVHTCWTMLFQLPKPFSCYLNCS